ncbi:hypothetical protein pE33L466_0149 (plasmid) [Bacillus cereus E33L]|uniref:Uncharacterized protein n=1 Tax=Bacillus cereus (strain ZK / E33L) TaxID=288681 RepID=Q4V1U8_BACCZ|nr:hypothetical protein pE33L466_0149 [Bacillus cereus E33L]
MMAIRCYLKINITLKNFTWGDSIQMLSFENTSLKDINRKLASSEVKKKLFNYLNTYKTYIKNLYFNEF